MVLFFPETQQKIEENQIQVDDIIARYDPDSSSAFRRMLELRIDDFVSALKNEQLSRSEKKQTRDQYARFYETLLACLQHPASIESAISSYQRKLYYPVGIHDLEPANPHMKKLSLAAITLGVTLLCSAIPAFVFNPLIAITLVTVAITLLLPSCFYIALPNSLDTSIKKNEERLIFETGAALSARHSKADVQPEMKQEPAPSL